MSGIRYDLDLRDYLDEARSYTIVHSKAPNGDTIARATVNGHPFEARHANEQRATARLTQEIESAELKGLTLDPPKP